MDKQLPQNTSFLKNLYSALFTSWLQLFFYFLKISFAQLARLNLFQLFYLFLLFCMIKTASSPWLYYKINFMESIQSLNSSIRWFFLSLSFLNIVILFFDFGFRKLLTFLSLLSLGFAYIWGFIQPEIIHSFIASTDYKFSYNLYIFGISLGLAILIGPYALGSSLVTIDITKKYLSKIPSR